MRQRLAGRRIDDVLALAAFAVEPLAVDIKLEIGVHANLAVTRNEYVGGGLALSRAGRGHPDRDQPRYAPPLTWIVCPVT